MCKISNGAKNLKNLGLVFVKQGVSRIENLSFTPVIFRFKVPTAPRESQNFQSDYCSLLWPRCGNHGKHSHCKSYSVRR